MKESLDKELDFVAKHYEDGRFDPENAIRRFHARTGKKHQNTPHHRLWAAAAAIFAAVFVLFAGGYGVYSVIHNTTATSRPSEPVRQTEPPSAHIFVFENTPLSNVLEELSSYYNCSLTASNADICLSASFPDDDLENIVSAIETALDIDITIEK